MLGGLRRRRMYWKWIRNCVAFQLRRDGGVEGATRELLKHLHHHVAEGESEGIGPEWLASMDNLMEMLRQMHMLDRSSIEVRLRRLTMHWQKDPENTTPPPGSEPSDADIAGDAERRLGKRESTHFSGS